MNIGGEPPGGLGGDASAAATVGGVVAEPEGRSASGVDDEFGEGVGDERVALGAALCGVESACAGTCAVALVAAGAVATAGAAAHTLLKAISGGGWVAPAA